MRIVARADTESRDEHARGRDDVGVPRSGVLTSRLDVVGRRPGQSGQVEERDGGGRRGAGSVLDGAAVKDTE